MKIISKIKGFFQKKKSNEKKEIDYNKKFDAINEIKNIFSNADKLKIYSLIIFLVGIFYQLFKILINSNMASLEFFSYTNTINDFIYIIGFSFSLTMLFSLIQIIIIFIIELTYFEKLKVILKIIFPLSLFLLFGYRIWNGNYIFSTLIIYLIFIILFIIYYYFITFNSYVNNKRKTYTIVIIYHIIIFGLLISNPSYIIACSNINISSNKCIELVYKNDKYGFGKDGQIYNLKDFKVYKTKKENIN